MSPNDARCVAVTVKFRSRRFRATGELYFESVVTLNYYFCLQRGLSLLRMPLMRHAFSNAVADFIFSSYLTPNSNPPFHSI
jgi:hypothetical protein